MASQLRNAMKGSAQRAFRPKFPAVILILSALAIGYAFYGFAVCGSPPAAQNHTPRTTSGPIVIQGKNGTVLDHLRISSAKGDCVTIQNSANITVKNSEIGPCAGSGIRISGGSGINIYDNYIHPDAPVSACCDKSDGIFAASTTGLTIQGNVIAYGEANIEVQNAATVKVIGNFLLNPRNTLTGSRGQNFQSWNGSRDILVANNYALASRDTDLYKFAENQEDSINFGETDGVIARNNYISGGHSRSGCGLIADAGANHVRFLNNILVNTGQCGIGIADGIDQVVQGNRIINRTPIQGGGNTAIYVWKQYAPPCGPVTISQNIATQIKANGTESSFWNGGGCGDVRLSGNVWGARAAKLLTPVQQRLPVPLIPPEPHRASAPSPFSNRTRSPGSGLSSVARPEVVSKFRNQGVPSPAVR